MGPWHESVAVMYPGSRVWRYGYRAWRPRWWQYLLPRFDGNDEFGRRVMVWPMHPFGWVAFAYWTCFCVDCRATRTQTRAYGTDEEAAVAARIDAKWFAIEVIKRQRREQRDEWPLQRIIKRKNGGRP